ncbi:MAG TPA: hypothetical protein VL383_05475 [Gemmatimonadaceae bacterium]|jgi:hypothetical protein|nr:hypothetical protein [Gemmatimonadaceae bacterium]
MPIDTIDDVPNGDAFASWRLAALDPDAFAASAGTMSIETRLHYLASLALLAPSTHNTVPLRLRIDSDAGAIEFALDRCAILPQSDAVGRQATVSLGAAIANAALAASAYGIEPSIELRSNAESLIRPFAEGCDPIVPVARLSIARDVPNAAARKLDIVAAMLRRKMVRAEYDERVKLDPMLAQELADIARRVHRGLTLHLITDAPTLLALGKFQELADSTVINRPAFSRELGDWFLENDSESTVGMRGREFGLSDDAAHRFRAGLTGAGPLLPDETVAFAKAGNLGMRSSSAVAVITAARDDLEHRLAAGRAFEEMALRLWVAGFAVAMHAGITEVEAPNMALRGRLRTFDRPTVVFRTGKPLRPLDGQRPHASRPSLEQVLY